MPESDGSEDASLAERLGIDPGTALGTLGRVVRLALRHRRRFALALAASVAAALFNLATPRLLGRAVDQTQALLNAAGREGRASLLIAHRLATVRDADHIIVLKDGAILEQGSPADLLAAGGLYAALHRHNFSSFDEVGSEDVQSLEVAAT